MILPDFNFARPISAPLVVGLLSLLALTTGCSKKVVRPVISINDLAGSVSLPITLEGKVKPAYLSGDSSVYSEWAMGTYVEGRLPDVAPSYQSIDSFVVVTPKGIIPVGIYNVRLMLGPYFSRTFNAENMSIAPLTIQKKIEKEGGTVVVYEYLLQPSRTYYARVVTDSLSGRKEDASGSMEMVRRQLLEISDRPYSDSAYQSSRTPAYR